MFYPTLRAILTALLGVPVALALALLLPGSWQAGLAWSGAVLLLFLLDAVLAARPSRAAVALDLPEALAIGRKHALGIAVRFPGRVPAEAELLLDVDGRLVCEPRRQAIVPDGDLAETQFFLNPLRRGAGHIEQLWLRWRGPLGLAYVQRVQELAHKVAILPPIPAVKEEAARLFQRDRRGGSHLDLDIRQGSEFHALRDWQPGHNRRSIDWKQSARHRKLLAREFQAENDLHVWFALDTGRLMCDPLAGMPRIDRALQAALLMAYVGLRLGDNVGLYAFGDKPVLNSGLLTGTNAFATLQRLASDLDYSTGETNFTLGLTELGGKLKRASIVVVFTEFADTTSAELMLENVGRLLKRHTVLFVAFRDEEVEAMLHQPPDSLDDVSRTMLADAMQTDRDKVLMQLRRQGAHVVDAPYDQIGMRLIETYMKLKRQERP
jgi:uncharacterized protein (DUF58 family)